MLTWWLCQQQCQGCWGMLDPTLLGPCAWDLPEAAQQQALLPPCPTQKCFLLQFRVTMGQHPQGLPLWLHPCLGGTAKPQGWSSCLLLSLGPKHTQIPPKSP